MQNPNNHPRVALKNWRSLIKGYQQPNSRKAIFQIINSFLPFLGLWVLMYFSLEWSYWITFGLAVVAAWFMVRIFIIQHDCGHQSFLKSRKLNNFIGYFSSFFSTIPYTYWSRVHAAHHAHNGQLEFRGIGDIHFLTTEEYKNKSFWGKFGYRLTRTPVAQFLVKPIIYLTVFLRFPFVRLRGWKKIRWGHFLNNLGVLAVNVALALLLGWQKYLLIQIPILLIFGMIAFWFFYIQHQHEENYKEGKDQWDHLLASIQGSTYYKLPRLFQWLSGNIGFHHIHHLSSKIPNYNLEACTKENPELNQYVNILTFRESLKCIHNNLWDENNRRMISFREFSSSRS